MPSVEIEVAATLPYLLRLEVGSYSSLVDGRASQIVLQDIAVMGNESAQEKRTQVSLIFDSNVATDDDIQCLKTQKVEALLQHTNRLLRWYRVTTGRAEVTELARAQSSPYRFRVLGEDENLPSMWTEPIVFEASPLRFASGQTVESITQVVRGGLSGRHDPEVSELFLLDAEQTLREGRFRETVLFCWSAIDATFSQKYKFLIHNAVEGKDEREAFVNFRNASMRYRMSAGLLFCTGQSLYEQPGDLWANLNLSYNKRNKIIHEGEFAQEADAVLSIKVAHQIVEFLATLQPKNPINRNEIDFLDL